MAAHGRAIPDVLAPGLAVVFCGINPGLWSAATAHHFARPGNRFWPALHRGGFTPRQLDPAEQESMLTYGLGITNLVERGTARADELTAAELVAGAELLARQGRAAPAGVARGARRHGLPVGVRSSSRGRRSTTRSDRRHERMDPAESEWPERALHARPTRRRVRRAAQGRDRLATFGQRRDRSAPAAIRATSTEGREPGRRGADTGRKRLGRCPHDRSSVSAVRRHRREYGVLRRRTRPGRRHTDSRFR